MTVLAPLRATLAHEFVERRTGQSIGARQGAPTDCAALMVTYLRHVTRRAVPMPVDPDTSTTAVPVDWQGKAGRSLMAWADYTPGPYVPRGEESAHRATCWPSIGDIIVCAATPEHPWGTMGIYLGRHGDGLDAVWDLFSQGPGPATVYQREVRKAIPLGWWRVRDSHLLGRDDEQERAA